jgi:hypothetical protein
MKLLSCSNDLPIPDIAVFAAKETSRFASGTYLVFQLLGFTAPYITIRHRELLPHIFTFTSLSGKFIFCGTFRHHFHGAFLLGSRMLYVARTFLLDFHHGDRTACLSKI